MVSIYQDAKRRGIYLVLFTDPEGIYQISWINWKKVNFYKLKTSLGRNFVFNLQTFRGFVKCIFRFCCKFSMKIIFYLSVNTDKVVCVCMTATLIANISSSENVSK